MPSLDPFTQAARAIVAALQASPGFTAIVRPGNVIDMSAAQFNSLPAQAQAGDLPQVAIIQSTFSISIVGPSSRSSQLTQSFILSTTLDTLNSQPLNALKYQTFLALLKSGADLGLPGLLRTWSLSAGKHDPAGNSAAARASARWTSLLTLTMEMYIDPALC